MRKGRGRGKERGRRGGGGGGGGGRRGGGGGGLADAVCPQGEEENKEMCGDTLHLAMNRQQENE